MKRLQKCLLLCALIMIAVSAVRPALSYFTTNVTAKGGYVVHLQEDSKIEETAAGLTKSIVIQNTDKKVPVYVRARAIASSKYTPTYTPGTGWSSEPDAEGWFYYADVLEPGQSTASALVWTVTTPKLPATEASQEINNVNVVVVYESVPVLYNADGSAIPTSDERTWSQKVTTEKQERSAE